MDCTRSFPSSRRKDTDSYIDFVNKRMNVEDDTAYLNGSFLEDIDKFDYGFFRLSPKEASLMDPIQRMFLKIVWHAIEDAGYGGKIENTDTGIYIGYAANIKDSYQRMVSDVDPALFPLSAVGNITAMMPTRISYLLNLKGPSMVIDTACSATLVAAHLACKAIKNGDCSMAIVAGVRICLLPVDKDYYKVGIESSDGRTRSFDNAADGSGIGEGAGAIILKPLKKALEDGDNIHAVIKGSAINQDGASMGITAPNPEAQTEVIVKAWENAGINPETLSFIENHGTATKLGDPIEIDALTNAFRRYTSLTQFCAAGSMKSNIGHLYEAAGAAGLIKSVLALKNREIPPTNHFTRPNSAINFNDTPVYISGRLRKWNDASPMRCGVSGFGFSGTNCHIVLEEAPEVKRRIGPATGSRIFTLSAKSEYSLMKMAESYCTCLHENDGLNFNDICYTVNTGRWHLNFRIAVIADSVSDLKEKLKVLTGCEGGQNQSGWFYSGMHRLVPQNKEIKSPEDITENEKQEMASKINGLLDASLSPGNDSIKVLKEIAKLYVSGADADWERLYQGVDTRKISLPLYVFDESRCWLSTPGEEAFRELKGHLYYKMAWKKSKDREPTGSGPFMPTLVINCAVSYGTEVPGRMKKEGANVSEAYLSDAFEICGSNKFCTSTSLESFTKLLSAFDGSSPLKIIYFSGCGMDGAPGNLEELKKRLNAGVYGLFNLSKAIGNLRPREKTEIVLVSDYAHSVTGDEEVIKPENSTFLALGKVIKKEMPQVEIRAIDIDESTPVDKLYEEIMNIHDDSYVTALRRGTRYCEEFSELDLEQSVKTQFKLESKGVYVITGGLGGIGLEAARYFAGISDVRLVLIGRTPFPCRGEWEDILENSRDNKLCNKIRRLLEMEEMGSEVICISGDVTKEDDMERVFDGLRRKYGGIKGVVHAAGVGGAELIASRSIESFDKVFLPKVQGTWILDKVTRKDSLDFFIMFSSIASVFSAPGQGDYISANSYMDSFSSYRKSLGEKALTINWATWKETGMSADLDFTADTLFKTLTIKTGIEGFEAVLNTDVSRVLIGQVNFESRIIHLMNKSNFDLSESLRQNIKKYGRSLKTGIKVSKKAGSGEVRLTGSDFGDCYDTEKHIAAICKEILGFDEINVHDSFFELGADSILLIRISALIEEKYPGRVVVTDMFTNSTIAKLARFIKQKEETEEKAPEEQTSDSTVTDNLNSIIDQLEKGNLSIDQVIKDIINM